MPILVSSYRLAPRVCIDRQFLVVVEAQKPLTGPTVSALLFPSRNCLQCCTQETPVIKESERTTVAGTMWNPTPYLPLSFSLHSNIILSPFHFFFAVAGCFYVVQSAWSINRFQFVGWHLGILWSTFGVLKFVHNLLHLQWVWGFCCLGSRCWFVYS